MSHFGAETFATPLLIEPVIVLTCSIVHSADSALSSAGDAVRNFLKGFVEQRVHQRDFPRRGVDRQDLNPAKIIAHHQNDDARVSACA